MELPDREEAQLGLCPHGRVPGASRPAPDAQPRRQPVPISAHPGHAPPGGTISVLASPGNQPGPSPRIRLSAVLRSSIAKPFLVRNGGFIQVTKRFSQNIQVLVSYTLSKAIDTAPDGTSVVTGNAGDDAKVAQDTLQPNLERGSSVNNIRNRFVLSAVWDLNYANSMSNAALKAVLPRMDALDHFAASIWAAHQHRRHGQSGQRRQQFQRPGAPGRPQHARRPRLADWDLRLRAKLR